ncbi:hypothetical protein BGZ92_009561 [Podila epicladia]|nr:hypothetical protein BGZ92_009561 [Podila epicladia]
MRHYRGLDALPFEMLRHKASAGIAGLLDPATAIYIGDDLRDIQAGRAAGMSTIAAAYGYCGSPTPPESWAADYIVYTVAELHTLLNRYFQSHATA